MDKQQCLEDKFLYLLYPLIMLYYLLIAMGINIYGLYYIVPLGIYICWKSMRKNKIYKVERVMIIYIIYSLCSALAYLTNGYPFECFTISLLIYIFPLLFFFVGCHNSNRGIYKIFVYAALFCDVVGIFLLIFRPSWYVNYVTSTLNNTWYFSGYFGSDDYLSVARFTSFFNTPYIPTVYSVFGLCVVFNDLVQEKYERIFKSDWFIYIASFIFIFSTLLSQQRVAYVFLLIAFIFYCVIGFKHGKNKIFNIIAFVILLVLGISTAVQYSPASIDLHEKITHRIDAISLDGIFNTEDSRKDQFSDVLKVWNNILLGSGLGTRGGYARMYGYEGVTDGNLLKILVEQGIIGALMIFGIFSLALRKCIQNISIYSLEFMIILYLVLAGFVADSFCFSFHTAILFWIAMGRVWNQEYRESIQS